MSTLGCSVTVVDLCISGCHVAGICSAMILWGLQWSLSKYARWWVAKWMYEKPRPRMKKVERLCWNQSMTKNKVLESAHYKTKNCWLRVFLIFRLLNWSYPSLALNTIVEVASYNVDQFLKVTEWKLPVLPRTLPKAPPQTKKTNFASSDPDHSIQFMPSDILSGKSSGILSGILFEILSGISSGILSISICHIFWHSIWHIYLAFHLACLLTLYLAYLRLFFRPLRSGWGPARPTALRLSPAGVRRGALDGRWGPARPLRSRAGRGGPARPTAIESWQLRSGGAHCNQELAKEVRRGPLLSRAGSWDPALPSRAEMRSGEEGRRKEGGAGHLT